MTGDGVLEATVLICSRGRPQLLLETVRSVLAGGAVPSELLVVDQSAEPHPDVASQGAVRGCEVRYLHAPGRGLSRARNVGLRAASSAVLVALDDDMLVEADWLERLLGGHALAGPRGVATGRVLAAPAEGAEGTVPAAALVTSEVEETFRGRQRRDVVPGANVAFHRDDLLRVGGWDERLGPGTRFASAEDNDLGYRLLEAGCEVRHVPAAVVLHRAWRSRRERLRLRWDYGRGKGAFYAKHLRLADRFTLQRLLADVAGRGRRAAASRSARVLVHEAVSVAGIASGLLGWTVRERLGAQSRRSSEA